MVRAAEGAGLAGFAFTEHVFHINEARAASRYLGTRWDGELEGPPIDIGEYLSEIGAAAEAVPAGGGAGGGRAQDPAGRPPGRGGAGGVVGGGKGGRGDGAGGGP